MFLTLYELLNLHHCLRLLAITIVFIDLINSSMGITLLITVHYINVNTGLLYILTGD